VTGEGVLLAAETLKQKRRDMGPYTFGCQMLQNPSADETQGFKREWLRHYTSAQAGEGMNKYILVDAASSKKSGSDYTAMWVIGLGPDGNYYALDIVRDRLALSQRTARLIELHKKWKPLQVRYETYGLQSDIEHILSVQELENYRFKITPVGGQVAKPDRIKRLTPIFEQGRAWFPHTLHLTNYEGETRDMVRDFVEEEFAAFPVGLHDDMLDALARIAEPDRDKKGKKIPEMELKWPDKSALPLRSIPGYGVLDETVGI
jgi:predicted phage terminase large subunit-like protein